MTNREIFHETFDAFQAPDGLLDRVLEQTGVPRHRARWGLRAAMVVALLAVVLSVTAVAKEQARQELRTRQDMADRCNTELETLRELGLFLPELVFVTDDNLPNIPEQRMAASRLQDAHPDEQPFYDVNLQLRPDTLRILTLSLSGETCPIAPDMTVGDYCDIWQEYHGYVRYELPDGVDADIPILEARKLEAWRGGIGNDYFQSSENGLTILFYKNGVDAPDTMYLSVAQSESAYFITFGSDYQKG